MDASVSILNKEEFGTYETQNRGGLLPEIMKLLSEHLHKNRV